jgi:hypothetical protein
VGDGKDKAPSPPVITPLPPPRAEPKLTHPQREQRSASADANRQMYEGVKPGTPSRYQELTLGGTLLSPKLEIVTIDFDYAHHIYDGITRFDPGQLVISRAALSCRRRAHEPVSP